ncbi:hypothetical protein FS749_009171 [Ceratobasidium sp. UAMH 11750]|nr:hypothetical protein FS749_009171 [Ceratobasidium sp. UAMH 11750]
MCEYLCDLAEEMLPSGSAGWVLLAAKFNTKFPDRPRNGLKLKKKLMDLANVNPIPTGNAPMDVIHRRSIEIKDLLTASVNSVTINDEVVPKALAGNEEGESENDIANIPMSNSEPVVWPTTNEDEQKAPGKSSALSVEIVDPPPKKNAPSKPPKAKPSAISGLKIKPKPEMKTRQIEPFPLSVLKTVKSEAGSFSGSKQPVVIDEDDSSSVEVLNKLEPEPTAKQGKRKAEDEGMIVVRKKPAPPASTPAKGTASRQQQSATALVNQILDQMNPERLKEMAEARHNASVTSSLLITHEGQISDLQCDMAALRDTKDAKIADLQHDIGTIRDSKDAVIAGLQRDMGEIRDRHDCDIRTLRDQHDWDMRETRDQYKRDLRDERNARSKAETELSQACSMNLMYGMMTGQPVTGSGGAVTTFGGLAGPATGTIPSALVVPGANPSVPAVHPQPIVHNPALAVPNASDDGLPSA